MQNPQPFIDELKSRIGDAYVLDSVSDKLPYETDWRGLYVDPAVCVALPATTQEVAEVIKICAKHKVQIVPQSGNSGLSGASTPLNKTSDGKKLGPQMVLSVRRMNKIVSIDTVGNTAVVEAGCILETLQNAALTADRFFPLNLGARGTCQIGGNISTNAGGVNVLAYGNTRALVLGLEAVLADGSIWDGLSHLHKDNTGFDLKHLFIGGEGLLGVITKAVVKLYPLASRKLTIFSAIESPRAGVEILGKLQNAPQGLLTSIELLPRIFVEQGQAAVPGLRDPFAEPFDWYLLTEHSFFGGPSDQQDEDIQSFAEETYGTLMEQGLLLNATIAQSEQQAKDLWEIREGTTPTQASLGASIKHDVSVGIADVPALIEEGFAALQNCVPNCVPVPFGHLGDGNIHFNVCQPPEMTAEAFRAKSKDINRVVHDIVLKLGGSISAEHGIGRLRREELARTKDPVALHMMRQVKAVLDPEGLFNPGKTL